MEIKRRTEILVETDRRLVIRLPAEADCRACPECRQTMLTAEHAAALFGTSQRAIFQAIEAGAIHFLECEMGVLLVCPQSFATIKQLPTGKSDDETPVR